MTKTIFTGDKKRILLPIIININTLANGHWREVGWIISKDVLPELHKKGTPERIWLEELREDNRKKCFPSIQG